MKTAFPRDHRRMLETTIAQAHTVTKDDQGAALRGSHRRALAARLDGAGVGIAGGRYCF